MKSTFQEFKHEGLTIEITAAVAVTIKWQGKGDIRNPAEVLSPYLAKLAAQAASRLITLDFRPLEYANSSTVGAILQFVKQLDSHGAEVLLRYDSSVSWQRVNFLCMRTIARTLSNVRVADN